MPTLIHVTVFGWRCACVYAGPCMLSIGRRCCEWESEKESANGEFYLWSSYSKRDADTRVFFQPPRWQQVNNHFKKVWHIQLHVTPLRNEKKEEQRRQKSGTFTVFIIKAECFQECIASLSGSESSQLPLGMCATAISPSSQEQVNTRGIRKTLETLLRHFRWAPWRVGSCSPVALPNFSPLQIPCLARVLAIQEQLVGLVSVRFTTENRTEYEKKANE